MLVHETYPDTTTMKSIMFQAFLARVWERCGWYLMAGCGGKGSKDNISHVSFRNDFDMFYLNFKYS